MYGKSSSSSVVCIPNEVRTDLWLSKTSDAEKTKFVYQDVDVVSLANKGKL